MDIELIKNALSSSPALILDKNSVTRVLQKLTQLKRQCSCKVLYSVKALPFATVMDWVSTAVDGYSVSSLFEARWAAERIALNPGIAHSVHLTTPGISPDQIVELSQHCSHISFNSYTQYQRYAETISSSVSVGLRINPKLSFLADDRFDPCRRWSKLGVSIDEFYELGALKPLQGLHIHNAFSALDFDPLIKTMDKLTDKLRLEWMNLKWLNLGGGYLFDQIENFQPFIEMVTQLRDEFSVDVYIEPGKALVGHAGHLVATVIDTFISDNERIAVLDTSVNHNPEVFEYQRQPILHEHALNGEYRVMLVGCTCLAGDIFGWYQLDKPLVVGDRVTFKQVGAYSLIKANRFNGYNLPDIYTVDADRLTKVKQYQYMDYRNQWLND